MFEVKATHWVVSSGEAACEVYPDVFVDEGRRVFVNAEVVADACAAVAVCPAEEADYAFVVEDEATELAASWIAVLSGDPIAWQEMVERAGSRESPFVPRVLPDFGVLRASRKGDERTVKFEVRATHRLTATRELACEIYPDVFVRKRGSAISRLAGMAMQQPGDIVEALPDDARDWFVVDGLRRSVRWVTTSARLRKHGARSARAHEWQCDRADKS
ncbi:hypothetical protein Br6_05190 [Rhodococcus sp. Br-6]|nr:hypothetical protein Br6_05190 [Rhodococcus sp. Br-6]